MQNDDTKDIEAPELEFVFDNDNNENIDEKIKRILSKRNQILKSMGYEIDKDGNIINPKEDGILRK